MTDEPKHCDQHAEMLVRLVGAEMGGSQTVKAVKELQKTAKEIQTNELPHMKAELTQLNVNLNWVKWVAILALGLRGVQILKDAIGW